MEEEPWPLSSTLGYEFAREEEARAAASDLDRHFTQNELAGLRIYRVRWNDNYLVEAAFSDGTPEARLKDAVALLASLASPYTLTTSLTTNAPRTNLHTCPTGYAASSAVESTLRPRLRSSASPVPDLALPRTTNR